MEVHYWMVTHICKEWCDTCQHVWGVVVCHHGNEQQFTPVVLFCCYVVTEPLLQGLVKFFCLAVQFQVAH